MPYFCARVRLLQNGVLKHPLASIQSLLQTIAELDLCLVIVRVR